METEGLILGLTMVQVKVYVTLKPSLLDAQGKVVQGALQQLGYGGVEEVRIGKYVEMKVEDGPELDADVREMCAKLLANPVIEDFRYEIEDYRYEVIA
jgi:phosphoribosylformylglycinamidine synthase PurS subunit